MWVRYLHGQFDDVEVGPALLDGGVVFVVLILIPLCQEQQRLVQERHVPVRMTCHGFRGKKSCQIKTLHFTYTINELIDLISQLYPVADPGFPKGGAPITSNCH